MANKGRSEPNLFGGYTHYDSKGNKIGRSDPGLFGGYTHYDANGHKTGRSDPGLFGGYSNYDAKGHKIGKSEPGLFGGYTHYDSDGHKTGSSSPNLFGGSSNYGSWNNTPIRSDKNNTGSQGCYIATCVYGSYNCPEVWTLRRFRDYTLAKRFWGRVFIKLYYTVSPKLVKCFGETKLFQLFWRKKLDRMVNSLNSNGVEDTPYIDKY
jgi:hypothetical protein